MAATNTYLLDVIGMEAPEEGYRRTPEGEKDVAAILPPGTIIRTSYGSGPYVVGRVWWTVWTSPEGDQYPQWHLALGDARRPGQRLDYSISGLVAVGGRILCLFANNDDEVFIDTDSKPARPIQLQLI